MKHPAMKHVTLIELLAGKDVLDLGQAFGQAAGVVVIDQGNRAD